MRPLSKAADASMQTRSFAAVLFRRMSTKARKVVNKSDPTELFMTLQEPQQIAIRGKLLQSMQSESTNNVRNKVGDAVAEIARQYSDEGSSLESPLLAGVCSDPNFEQGNPGTSCLEFFSKQASLLTPVNGRVLLEYLQQPLA